MPRETAARRLVSSSPRTARIPPLALLRSYTRIARFARRSPPIATSVAPHGRSTVPRGRRYRILPRECAVGPPSVNRRSRVPARYTDGASQWLWCVGCRARVYVVDLIRVEANMTGKRSQPNDSEDNQSRIKLIADKRRLLEERSAQIEAEIRSCFKDLTKVLQSREKKLLRQAEAIHKQQLSLIETSLDFLPSSIVALNDRNELEERIRQFGNIETHGSNSITVKDIEPYKVADYQDANKDHVSFDKSITNKSDQKAREHLSLPRCKDFISDYRTVRISSLPSTFLTDNQLRDSRDVKANALKIFKDTLSISGCSPLLIIKRKLGLTHVSLDGLHAFDKTYSPNVQPFGMSCKTAESRELEDSTNEATETNLQELDKKVSDRNDSELIRYPKEREKSYEHPIQVQQWLQQILAETEIEPAIQEIGQFSEISKAKLCNEL